MRTVLLLLACLLGMLSARGQQLVSGEFFIDTDPGFGEATPLTFTPNESILTQLTNFELNDPDRHFLGFRFRDAEGTWGHTVIFPLYVVAFDASGSGDGQVVYGEFFLGDDPGIGQATELSFVVGSTVLVSLPNFELTEPGRTILGFRFKNGAGTFGDTRILPLFATSGSDVIALNFINWRAEDLDGNILISGSEPVSGNSVSVDFTEVYNNPALANSRALLIATPTSSTSGTGISAFLPQFINLSSELQPIDAIEWQVLNDNGPGGGTLVELDEPLASLEDFNFSALVDESEPVFQNLTVRARNQAGFYSFPAVLELTVEGSTDPCADAGGDTDGDGVCDDDDGCPNDPDKTAPGQCGCGNPDTDTDSDGTADCVDACPNDPNKIAPGFCGCGNPETNTDGDALPDCVDNCPLDPNKVNPGQCGCGTPDTDTDGDGIADCNDECPNLNPASCSVNQVIEDCECVDADPCAGAGGDTDGDGVCDNQDGCPNDPDKIAPGQCGCGNPDTDSDGDGVADCNDACPTDPDKTSPGQCGCDVADTDTDGDGTADCNDACPSDPEKTNPGVCGCGTPDTDSDGDTVADCEDACPNDPNKTDPGTCGCGVADTDSDGDGLADCVDECPLLADLTNGDACQLSTGGSGVVVDCECLATDPCADVVCEPSTNPCETVACSNGECITTALPDSDGDGLCDEQDACPNDPNKTEPGTCGCGVADTDSDDDGLADCVDECPLLADLTNGDACQLSTGGSGVVVDCECLATDPCADVVCEPSTDPCETVACSNGECITTALPDSDGDGLCDEQDACPNDPNKTEPGTCGCGVADTDSDDDGLADCVNECPLLADLTNGDACQLSTGGSGVVVDCECLATDPCADVVCEPSTNPCETVACSNGECITTALPDSDGDGLCDEQDACPNDPNKTEPGTCGCGVADTDSDGDGLANCVDECPLLADLTNGDACQLSTGGSGVVVDCECLATDPCADVVCEPSTNPCETVACSNGECITTALPDSDGDGLCDEQDACPNDPTNSCEPTACNDFRYYLVNHGSGSPGTALYGVTLTGAEAQLTPLATIPGKWHMAYDNINNEVLLVASRGNRVVRYLPQDGSLETAYAIQPGLSKVFAAGFNQADGLLYVASANTGKIYTLNPVDGSFSEVAQGPVSGGDLTWLGNELYLARRQQNSKLYRIEAGNAVQTGTLNALVTGLCATETGQLLSSHDGIASLFALNTNGETLETYQLTLNGETFVPADGDLASGCNFSPDEQVLCEPTEVVEYLPGATRSGNPIEPIRTDPYQALGAPENDDSFNFVSLGYGGELTLFYAQGALNGPGDDIQVFETTFNNQSCASYSEVAEVYASAYGVDWVLLGTACTNEDNTFDLGDLPLAHYIRLIDVTPADSPSEDGFDVDAVVALNGCGGPDFDLAGCETACLAELDDEPGYIQGVLNNGGDLPASRSDASRALEVQGDDSPGSFVSLGYGGSITLCFGGRLFNEPGADFEVVETSFGDPACQQYPEYANISVSPDGSTWYAFEEPVCLDAAMDLSDISPLLPYVEYVRIANNDTLSTTPDGYDVDGVRNLNAYCLETESMQSSGHSAGVALNTEIGDSSNSSRAGIKTMASPVPAVANVVIEFEAPFSSVAKVEVFSLSGILIETLHNAPINANQVYRTTMDVTDLVNGIYLYRIVTPEETQVHKILVSK